MILFSYNKNKSSGDEDPQLFGWSNDVTEALFNTFGALSLVLLILILLPSIITSFYMSKYKFILITKDKIYQIEQESTSLADMNRRKLWFYLKSIFLIGKLFLSDLMVVYLLICLASIILGLTFHPTYYAFLLTYLIVLSPSMNNLLVAIWEPRLSLLSTLLLMLIMIYGFAVIGYRNFHSDYPSNV